MDPFPFYKDINPAVVKLKQVNQKKEKRLGKIKGHKGHTLFELNLKTKDIRKADIESVDYVIGDQNEIVSKVIENPDCVYISALNQNNALKKFFKSIEK